jgi:3-phenylpropionate/trans-cinnamate dioxygenase ferredoxin subunit
MDYFKVATITELKAGEKKKVTIGETDYLLVNIEGTYYAIDNKCPHMGGSLFNGTLSGDEVTCPRHGSVFNVKTGEVVERGKMGPIRIKVKNTRSYPVKVEGDEVLIGIS